MSKFITAQLANAVRGIYNGPNYAGNSMAEVFAGLSYVQAVSSMHGLNSIAVLTYHVSYYMHAVGDVLDGKPLTAKDKYSFDHPPLGTETNWLTMRDETIQYAESLAERIEQLYDENLADNFDEGKYGSIYKNIVGCIEHTYYHVGQMVIIKKMIQNKA